MKNSVENEDLVFCDRQRKRQMQKLSPLSDNARASSMNILGVAWTTELFL